MILAIDSAMATCGFAVLQRRPVRVVELGVITTEQNPDIDRRTDRARRIALVTRRLDALRIRHGVTLIAGEQALGHGTVHAVIPQALCWGALIGLAIAADIDLAEVPAKDWQHAAQPSSVGGKVNYAKLKADLAAFAGPRIDEVPNALQTHALDAIGIGLYAALSPVVLVHRGKARRELDRQRAAIEIIEQEGTARL